MVNFVSMRDFLERGMLRALNYPIYPRQGMREAADVVYTTEDTTAFNCLWKRAENFEGFDSPSPHWFFCGSFLR